MAWIATAVVGGSVIGGLMAQDAASTAADAQTAAANQANETQRYMYDTTRADNAPFLANGTAGSNRLAYMLGLSPTPNGVGVSKVGANDLIDTSHGDWRPNAELYANDGSYKNAWDKFIDFVQSKYHVNPSNSNGADIEMAQKQLGMFGFDVDSYNKAHQQQLQQTAQADPAYGSLLRKFTQNDLNSDPVYQTGLQFGLDEGNKGIERQAAASGQMLSGATLKALAKYATDYAGTKAGEAYNRFNNDQTNIYNRLAGMAGSAQQASSQVGSAGQNYANNVSQNQIGIGNARAASAIGQANAWTGALGQGMNWWQSNKLLSGIGGSTGAGGYADEMSRLNSQAALGG